MSRVYDVVLLFRRTDGFDFFTVLAWPEVVVVVVVVVVAKVMLLFHPPSLYLASSIGLSGSAAVVAVKKG